MSEKDKDPKDQIYYIGVTCTIEKEQMRFEAIPLMKIAKSK